MTKNLPHMFCLLLFLVVSEISPLAGQTVLQDFDELTDSKFNSGNQKQHPAIAPWQRSTVSEFRLIAYSFFASYQKLISSQDKPSCMFHPTCSAFAQQALGSTGFVKGLLLASDRLQRCHGLPGSFNHYVYDPRTGRLYDPTGRYVSPVSQEVKK